MGGSVLVGVGSFGGSWLDFPRSGNYLAFPGSAVLHAGLVLFGVQALRTHIAPRWGRALPLLIGVLPIALVVVSQAAALATGARLLYIHDAYFQAMLVVRAGLWLLLGMVLWSEGRELAGANR